MNVTMDNMVGWGARHRELTFVKVENGYTVNAKFAVEREGRHKLPEERYWETERRDYVFPTLSEAMAFINEYMTKDAEELKTGAS